MRERRDRVEIVLESTDLESCRQSERHYVF